MLKDDIPAFEFQGPWGVPVQLGGSLLFLILIFVDFTSGPDILAYSLGFFAMIVGSIFLHEMGHAWGALIQGVPVRRVMIYGGGGFCEHAPSSRYEDELIVAMGPLTNLAIWAIASLGAGMTNNVELNFWLLMLAELNLFLTLFNLIPVFPLDGGRLFSLLLCRFMHPVYASRICGAVGILMVVAWIPAMLFSYVFLGFVLIFFPPILLHWRLLRGEISV